jgi:hypothetical protein
MATELARVLSAAELVEKNICPIKREFIRENPQARIAAHVVGSTLNAPSAVLEKKSARRLKKVQATHTPVCNYY